MAGKAELVERIAGRAGSPKGDVARALGELLAESRRTSDGGETIAPRGFGTSRMGERAAREGRNPRTGEGIEVAATRSLAFGASK